MYAAVPTTTPASVFSTVRMLSAPAISGAAGASFAEGDLSLLVGGSSAELPLTSVEAGPVVELGGPGLLQPGPPPANRLVWLLWAVLGAAVLLLLWLSLRLWRRIDGPRSDEAGAAGADDGRAAGGRQDG